MRDLRFQETTLLALSGQTCTGTSDYTPVTKNSVLKLLNCMAHIGDINMKITLVQS